MPIEDLKVNIDKWIPAFIYRNNPRAILEIIDAASLSDVMIIFHIFIQIIPLRIFLQKWL